MSGRRVYEVAKELGVPNKELLDLLRSLGEDVKSHSSALSDEVVVKVREAVAGPPPKKAPKEPAKAPKEPPKAKRGKKPAAEKSDVVRQEQTRKTAPTRPPRGPGDSERGARPEPAPAEPRTTPKEAVAAPPEAQPEAPPEAQPEVTPEAAPVRPIVHRGVTVKEFAEKLGVSAPEVIKTLMRQGSMKTITQSMSDEEILVVSDELGVEVEIVEPEVEERIEAAAETAEALPPEDLESRPPVVTVMGHVDHGKTTVLDRIRQADVAAQEHGGITQHIGAYQIEKDGNRITFIDTPGHEAFTAMRARGAQVTDLAVLVVAADDGVMPQTLEAIDHARAAHVPIVVAVNKVDKPESDPTRVRTELSEHGLQPQEWGGESLFVDMSAKIGTNIDELLTAITLVSEELRLQAPAGGAARGVVLEAHLDRGRGPVATVLVQKGTLEVGDALVAGASWGKVRAMLDEYGEAVKRAAPSRPVLVLGWSSVPRAGDEARVVADERQARRLAQERDAARRAAELVTQRRAVSLEELFAEGGAGELNLILKADVQGGVEALADALGKIDVKDVRLSILHRGVGAVTENDVTLAKASRAIIVGFNVRPDVKAREAAAAEGVDIRTYRVIYQAIDEIEQALKGLLAPEFREYVLGSAEVRDTFKVPRAVIAGSYVTNGEVVRGGQARLVRDGAVVFEGRIGSLRRFKEDVRSVQQGFECGIGLEGYTDVKVGDVIEVFEVRQVARA